MNENEQTFELKNKIAELKQRLNQIYAQYFTDTSKSRVFETEFSLYLKACEHPRKEITESLKLQYDVTKIGLFILIGASALTFYLFKVYILFGMLILLGLGFCACGFMYFLLAAEIKIARASEFCAELETYFQRYRWSTELKESLNLPDIPLWGDYIQKWNKDLFDEGHFEKKSLYAPFRIIMTLVDFLALFYVIQSFIFQEHNINYSIFIAFLILWVMAVILQILLVNMILNKVDIRLRWIGEKLPEKIKKQEINWAPHTWINILRLFLLLDLIFPRQTVKDR
ncbi:MAG: hypothetical protein IBX72_05585 [Nitrospirae bacterium]|jgi:hypothetical protein|nr:hypothetical protein [Nitrospirota bacterium]